MRKKSISSVLVIGISLLIVITAYFLYHSKQQQSFGVSTSKELSFTQNKLLNHVIGERFTILKVLGVYANLTPVLVKNNTGSQRLVAYLDKNAHFAFLGAVILPNGTNLTQSLISQNLPESTDQKTLAHARETHWIAQGKMTAPHKAYILVDPNCTFCHRFFEAVQPLVQSGKLAVRWVLVGMIKPSSEGKAAAILSAKDPLAMMKKNEKTFNEALEEGGIKPLASPNMSQLKLVTANNEFMKSNQILATPALVYRRQDGSIKVKVGMPTKDQLLPLVKTMGETF